MAKANKKRYFIVMFIAGTRGNVTWGLTGWVTGGSYINAHCFIKYQMDALNCDDVSIRNIIELSESDYNDWVQEDGVNMLSEEYPPI